MLALARPLSLALLACCLTSCTDYRIGAQEISLTHDLGRDVLVLTSDARGLYPGAGDLRLLGQEPGHSGEEKAADRIEAILDGGRYFLMFDWPFVLNLEGVEDPEVTLDVKPAELGGREGALFDAIARVFELAEGIRFESADLKADGADGLGLAQLVVFPRATELFAAIDEAIDALVILDLGLGAESDLAQGLDAESQRLWLAHATGDDRWIELNAGTLILRAPLSGTDLARVLRTLPKEAGDIDKDGTVVLGALLSALTEVRFLPGGLIELRFAPTDSGSIEWSFDRGEEHSGKELRALLAKRGRVEAPGD